MSNGAELKAIQDKLQQIENLANSIRNMVFVLFLLALAACIEVLVGWDRIF